MILYRGETPDSIEVDLYGGFGEIWFPDHEHARSYARGALGTVRQAALPENAKRLILIDSITEGYDWEAVEVLAQLTNNPLLTKTLQAGYKLYNIWRAGWTLAVKEAGYDSIASHSIEGPEEYVLNPSRLIPLDTRTSVEEKTHGA